MEKSEARPYESRVGKLRRQVVIAKGFVASASFDLDDAEAGTRLFDMNQKIERAAAMLRKAAEKLEE